MCVCRCALLFRRETGNIWRQCSIFDRFLRYRRKRHLPTDVNIYRTYSPFRASQYNLHVVGLDHDSGSMTVRHPGLTNADYDSNGNPSPWTFVFLPYAVFKFLQVNNQQNNTTLLKSLNEFCINSVEFVIASELLLCEQMYNAEVSKIPLYVTLEQGDVGDTSMTEYVRYFNDKDETLGSLKWRMVAQDNNTKLLRKTPVWMREKYKCTPSSSIVVDKLSRPSHSATYRTNIPWSDVGPGGYVFMHWYVRYIVDAMHHCVRTGQIDHRYQELYKTGIKRILTRNIDSLQQGVAMEIGVWADKHNPDILCFDLTTNDRSFCQCSLEFLS